MTVRFRSPAYRLYLARLIGPDERDARGDGRKGLAEDVGELAPLAVFKSLRCWDSLIEAALIARSGDCAPGDALGLPIPCRVARDARDSVEGGVKAHRAG